MKQGIPWTDIKAMDVLSVVEYAGLIAWQNKESQEDTILEEKQQWLHRDQTG